MKRFLLLFLLSTIWSLGSAQNLVQGSLTDNTGNPLAGASIAVQGSHLGTTTDAAGQFQLKLEAGQYTLVCSFVGYSNLLVPVSVPTKEQLQLSLSPDSKLLDEAVVAASRVGQNTPLTHATITQAELQARDAGKDLPMLIEFSPSIVTTSDAGAGVGYTDMRIRGSNIARINVTVNGVPLNDPESHGVFWVNMPDFSGNLNSIQIQRGVGTSSNGAAAFGASIDLQTISATGKPYSEFSSSYGSFNTHRESIKLGTGLLKNGMAFNLRLSQIASDGFIDRAWSDMKSYYFTGAYYGKNTTVKLTASSGVEHTYQAWYGIPKFKLENDKAAIEAYIADNWLSDKDAENLRNSNPRTYNYYTYDNETDNYQQDRYQLLFRQNFSDALSLQATLFYTHGEGYYEQYKTGRKLKDYGIEPPVIGGEEVLKSDLIQRKWLDNDFKGYNWHLEYSGQHLNLKVGQSANHYLGDHFGRVIWAQFAGNSAIDHEWYRGTGDKIDISGFAIANYQISESLYAFADLQYRKVGYKINGSDDDYASLNYDLKYNFFNPKAGLLYHIGQAASVYASWSRAHREPNRANMPYTSWCGARASHGFEG